LAVKTISYAASDIGKHRSSNQDSGYAGYQLFFVADGMGGHAGGDIASAIASQRIALTDSKYDSIEEAIETLKKGVLEANSMLNATVQEHPELEGMGTTFSGMLLHQGQMVTAHIGDSRIYLVRDGEMRQITVDHTFVQKLVDMGRITEEEALVHPRRSVLMRVLGDVQGEPELDIAIHENARRFLTEHRDWVPRVTQCIDEALTNSSRHGFARNVYVDLSLDGVAFLSLTVIDDGRGLAQPPHQGLGLASITSTGGTWQLSSQPLGGARLHVQWPLP